MAAFTGPILCGGRPISFLHFEDPFQNAVQKFRGLDDDDLHSSLLPLPSHTAPAASDQQDCHKEQEASRGKDRRDQDPQPQGQGADPQPAAVSHFHPPCLLVYCHYIRDRRTGDRGRGLFPAGAGCPAVGQRRFIVLFPEDPGEIGVVVEPAVLRHVDHPVVRLRQLLGRQLQTVIHQVGVEAHTRELLEELHEVALRKTAPFRRLLDGDLPVVAALDVVERALQSAIGQAQAAVAGGSGDAVLGHVVEELEEI